MKYTHIIWDWNGTLLNDVQAALSSVNDMLALRGKEPIDLDCYRECIGTPIKKFYERVFELEKEDYNLLLEQFNEGYMRHIGECRLTDGAKEAVEYFGNSGANQAIVSSSNNAQLIENVKKYGFEGSFNAVLGSEDFLAGSKIERAAGYLEKTGAKNGRILVVGDLEHDYLMAKELGADCVMLTSGHENRARLARCGVPLIDDLFALIPTVEKGL